jgi:hypothetical protein
MRGSGLGAVVDIVDGAGAGGVPAVDVVLAGAQADAIVASAMDTRRAARDSWIRRAARTAPMDRTVMTGSSEGTRGKTEQGRVELILVVAP